MFIRVMKQSARGVPKIAALKKLPANTRSNKVYSKHWGHGGVFQGTFF